MCAVGFELSAASMPPHKKPCARTGQQSGDEGRVLLNNVLASNGVPETSG